MTQYLYILVDPRDRRVRYVGCTRNPKLRLLAHCAPAQVTIPAKHEWLMDLRRHDLRPLMIVIGDVEWRYAASTEREVIAFYVASGAPLLNVATLGRIGHPLCGAPSSRGICRRPVNGGGPCRAHRATVAAS